MLRTKTTLFLLVLQCIRSSGKMKESPLGEVTSYFTVFDVMDQLPEAGECSPSMIWMLHKHGSRNPSIERLTKMKTTLPDLMDKVVQAWEQGNGTMLEKDIEIMKQWNSSSLDDETDKDLTPIGHLETRSLGNRWRKRVQHLFDDAEKVAVRTADEIRVVKSAEEFVKGAFDTASKLVIVCYL